MINYLQFALTTEERLNNVEYLYNNEKFKELMSSNQKFTKLVKFGKEFYIVESDGNGEDIFVSFIKQEFNNGSFVSGSSYRYDMATHKDIIVDEYKHCPDQHQVNDEYTLALQQTKVKDFIEAQDKYTKDKINYFVEHAAICYVNAISDNPYNKYTDCAYQEFVSDGICLSYRCPRVYSILKLKKKNKHDKEKYLLASFTSTKKNNQYNVKCDLSIIEEFYLD